MPLPLLCSQVDLFQLQVNTLRRYKRHYKLQTRPGLNKAQLAEVTARCRQNVYDSLAFMLVLTTNPHQNYVLIQAGRAVLAYLFSHYLWDIHHNFDEFCQLLIRVFTPGKDFTGNIWSSVLEMYNV